MSKSLKIVFGLGILVLALVMLLPQFIPTEKIWQQIQTTVEAKTGCRIAVATTPEFSLFPELKLRLNQVTLSNAEGSSQATMLTVERLSLSLPWSSLWSGVVSVDEFVVEKPVLWLEKDAKGRGNWQFLADGHQTEADRPATAGSSASLPELTLGDIRVIDGRISYSDQQQHTVQQLENLQLQVRLESLSKPLQIEGQADYQQQTHQLNLKLNSLDSLQRGARTSLLLDITSDLMQLNFDGQGQTQWQGKLSVKAASLRKLWNWQGIEPRADATVLQQFDFQSLLTLNEETLLLTDLSASLDNLLLTGRQQLRFTTPVQIRGELQLNQLDLNPYLQLKTADAGRSTKSDPSPSWDESLMDLSAMQSLDVQQKLSLAGLQVADIQMGASEANLTVKQGKLRFELNKFAAYQGHGTGIIELNSQQLPYQLDSTFSLADVDVHPLLIDALGFDKLLGQGQLKWQFSSKGQSQKALIEQLNGQLSFVFTDGAIRGANIAALVRSAAEALKGNWQAVNLDKDFSQSETTDFSEFAASIKFNQGMGQSDDLRLSSPLLRLTGQGSLNLPEKQLDYLLSAKLVASLEGQGAATATKGVTVPVRVKGPWSEVKIRPELSQAVKDKAKQKLEDKVKDKLKGLLGN